MKEFEITVEISARHVHLCAEDVKTLFGEGTVLTEKRPLSQPGQYLSEQRVRIEGSKKSIDNVAILGPERPATQVEVSLSDARMLGVDAPVRESGDIAGSGTLRLVGPAGSVELKEGVIAAKRHLHVHTDDAAKYGIKDKQKVSVFLPGERELSFDEVVVRVSPSFSTSMHIDVDEANAAGFDGSVKGIVRY